MAFRVPAGVEAVFGSRTRAKVLAYLADSSVPLTGYAISKGLELGPAKVYGELNKLESCGILVRSQDVRGNKVFLLDDEDLRRFLLRNLRILSASDWFSPERIADRRRAFEEARQITVPPPAAPSTSGRPPVATEFRRPPEKDRALRRVRRRSSGPR